MESELKAAIKLEKESQAIIAGLQEKSSELETAWLAKYNSLADDNAAQLSALHDKVNDTRINMIFLMF